jgi:hypothetical protein
MSLVTKAYLRLFAVFIGFSALAYLLLKPEVVPYAVAALAGFAEFSWRSLSHAYVRIQYQEQITRIMDEQVIRVSRFVEEYEVRLPDMAEKVRNLEAEIEDLKRELAGPRRY